ncbi:hypothetical protein MC28_1532 [Bacillus thuringiensis MC28]|nr:hypothetical protein MC28_1532 [Bacillus thuringiensis MC28]
MIYMPDIDVTIGVETEATSIDGKRDSKDSEWSTVNAEQGFVINKDKVKVEELVARGSEHTYELNFSDYVEFVPDSGVDLPRTMSFKVHARSEKKNAGGGGAMKIRVTGDFIKIPDVR